MKLNPENNTFKNSISQNKFYPSLKDYHSKNIMKTLGIILTPLMIFSCSDKDIPVNNKKVQETEVVEVKISEKSSINNKEKEIKKTSSKLLILKKRKRSKTKVTVDTIMTDYGLLNKQKKERVVIRRRGM